jgi:hypothetical protein
MNMVKIFDIAFLVGALVWVLFAWILPAVFNADSDITMWMVFLTIFLCIYGAGRMVTKFFAKKLAEIDKDSK